MEPKHGAQVWSPSNVPDDSVSRQLCHVVRRTGAHRRGIARGSVEVARSAHSTPSNGRMTAAPGIRRTTAHFVALFLDPQLYLEHDPDLHDVNPPLDRILDIEEVVSARQS
jgi:hypothetical protein